MHTYQENKHPQLYDLVKLCQLHRYSKTCRKYKDQVCRFNFGKFVTSRTIVVEPLPEHIPENEKILLQKQSDILTKVKNYINNYLNPFKVNSFYTSRDNL